MGMEGKLRRISEFELAAYRKTPSKLYSDLLAPYVKGGLADLTAAMKQLEALPVVQRIRKHVAAGLQPPNEDLEEVRKQQEAIVAANQDALQEMQSEIMGLSKDGRTLSLYKDWHLVHYFLTGKTWEDPSSTLEMAIRGGTEIPDVQRLMGYGPVRYLTPAQVKEVASALPNAPFAENLSRFDPATARAAKVYPPRHPGGPFEEDEKQSLLDYFALLQAFYNEASSNGEAILLWVE